MSFSKESSPLSEFYKTIDHGTLEEKINNIPDFPHIIELEITNQCNFHCIMCPTGLNIAERNRGVMEETVFDMLMEQTKDRNVAIKFVGQGESLINKNFISFASKAKEQKHVCHLTTNGSLLTENIMRALIEMSFDSVKFSFQGVDSTGYRIMRQREDFDELIEKIKTFKALKKGRKLPFITIGTSVTSETEDEINVFREFCDRNDICDRLEVGKTNLEDVDLSKIKDENIRQQVQEMKNQQTLNKVRLPYCNQVYDVITLRWNGDVSACCGDIDGKMVLGNIKQSTITELWMSPKEQQYRKLLSELKYDAIPQCRNCYDFMGYMGSDNKK